MVNAKLTRGTGLSAFTGLRLQNLPAFTASGKLTDVPNGYALAGLTLATAAATIAGDVAVTRGAKRLKVSAKTSSRIAGRLRIHASRPRGRHCKTRCSRHAR